MTEQHTTQESSSQTEQPNTQVPQSRQPTHDDLAVGPIDFLAVELPAARLDGSALRALLDLAEQGIIRILDLRAAKVDEDGVTTVVEITDLDGDGTLDVAVFAGARSGLLSDEDVTETAGLIAPGNAVGVLLYENTWAGPFVAALRRAGAEVIASGRIPVDDVVAMLDELEGAETDAEV